MASGRAHATVDNLALTSAVSAAAGAVTLRVDSCLFPTKAFLLVASSDLGSEGGLWACVDSERRNATAPSLCKGSGRLSTAEDFCCAWLGTATQRYQKIYLVLCLTFM